MASFNQVLLLGNLTRDPQLSYIPQSQQPVCNFGVACNRKYRTQSGEDREEVTFVDCAAFGKQAELINQYMTKGRPIFIQGRLKLDQWDDKQSGQKRSKLTVVVENFQFLGGRDGGPGGGGAPMGGDEYDQGAPPPRQNPSRPPIRRPAPQQQPPQDAPISDDQRYGDDDIPF
jgi:single-strand DNA-binding protein